MPASPLSVLSPTLFNLYTNDLPVTGSWKFIYADDICLTKQAQRYAELECCLSSDMMRMSSYCCLLNTSAARELRVHMEGQQLWHDSSPVYLGGVTLDRTLSYRQHLPKTAGKSQSRNNLLMKLAGSSNPLIQYSIRKNKTTSSIIVHRCRVPRGTLRQCIILGLLWPMHLPVVASARCHRPRITLLPASTVSQRVACLGEAKPLDALPLPGILYEHHPQQPDAPASTYMRVSNFGGGRLICKLTCARV